MKKNTNEMKQKVYAVCITNYGALESVDIFTNLKEAKKCLKEEYEIYVEDINENIEEIGDWITHKEFSGNSWLIFCKDDNSYMGILQECEVKDKYSSDGN